MSISSILIIGHHKISNGVTNARQDFRRPSRQKTCPDGQSGTGRLSFRLRKLQRNAKHPACQCSLRFYMEFRCRGCSLKQSTGVFLYRSRGVETRSLLRKNCRELRHSCAALRDGCVLIRQFSLRITETRPFYAPDPTGEVIDSANDSAIRRNYL